MHRDWVRCRRLSQGTLALASAAITTRGRRGAGGGGGELVRNNWNVGDVWFISRGFSSHFIWEHRGWMRRDLSATRKGKRNGTREEGARRRWGPDRAIRHEKRQRPRYICIWWDEKSRFSIRMHLSDWLRESAASASSFASSSGLGPCLYSNLDDNRLSPSLASPPPPTADSAPATFVSDTIWISLKQGAPPQLPPSETESRRWFVAASDRLISSDEISNIYAAYATAIQRLIIRVKFFHDNWICRTIHAK